MTNLTSLSVAGVPTMGMGGGGIPTTTGNVWFVSSASGSNGNTGAADNPFSTMVYAYSRCTASKGDIVVLMPGHAEAISASTAFAKAGVTVVGLGVGAARPTITLDTVNTATLSITAASNSFTNIIFVANFLSIAACFTLTTAADFQVSACAFRDTSSVLNFLNIVKSTGAANTVDGLTFYGNEVINLGVTSNNTTVLSANDVDRLNISYNYLKWAVQNDKAIAAVITTGVVTNALIAYNRCYRPNTTTAGGSLITVGGTTSTGVVNNNYVQTLTTTSDLLFTTTVGLAAFNNYVTGVVGASGFLIPAVDS